MKDILVQTRWRDQQSGKKRGEMYYKHPATGNKVYKMGPRTNSDPTPKQMKQWEYELELMAHHWQKELNSESNEYKIHMPVVTAAMKFVQWADENRSVSTVERFQRNLELFTNWVFATRGKRNVGSLSTSDYAQFRDFLRETQVRWKNSTVNLVLHDLSSWNKWCLGESYCIRNFAKLVNKLEVKNDKGEDLKIRGVEAYWELIESLDSDFQVAVVGLMATTGMRLDELRNMKWENSWDYHIGTLVIGAGLEDTQTKKHGRTHPVTEITRHYLQMLWCMQDGGSYGPYVCGTRMGRTRITSQMGKWLKPHGLSPKDLRAWFRSALATIHRVDFRKHGVMPTVINDLLGHIMSRTRGAYERMHDVEGTRPLMDEFSKWLMAGKPEVKLKREIPEMGLDESHHFNRRNVDHSFEDEDLSF
ncbi:hypothetical protein HN588_00860 [Candidatus Bathyarchaeota archaeon]|nr:hypothetical protein [Candidatus Bathyarchaeota archaeon]